MRDPIPRLNAALEGRYRIERQLGEGGMATVYLARDERHTRHVALKVLKPELAAVVGADRFLAEIETTANLQHPYILPLFDSGEADSFLFYVMPYVEGESLRDRLDREGQLPVDEAVSIATKIAGALQAAHDQGVIHRDIKPANVLLSKGEPLVSDFGIALAVGAAGDGRLTETGLSLGTPHYMSPEQATGDLHVGPPTDIYALGCVLYEMLVGEPPFRGSTPQAVLGKIITGKVPSVRVERTSVTRNVDDGIAKALAKIPADRFATASDFADVLSGRLVMVEPASAARGSTPRSWLGGALYLGGLVAVAVLTWVMAGRVTPPASPMRLSVALTSGQELRPPHVLRISSDGSTIVYTGPADTDETRLWVRDWSSLEGRPIPNTTGVWDFDVSPDKDEVALLSGNSIRIQAIASEATRSLAPGEASCCLTWSDEGDWIYFTNRKGGVSRISPNGGESETLTTSKADTGHLWPHPVPDSDLVVFEIYGLFGIDSRLALLDPDSKEYEEIGEGSYPTPVGDVVLSTNGDGSELRYAGLRARQAAATTVVTGLAWGGIGPDQARRRPAFDASATGDLVYAAGQSPAVNLSGVPVWVERDGTEVPIDSTLTGPFRRLRISPDGSRLLFDFGGREIHVKDLPDGPLVPITRDGTVNYRASWAPDGSVLYSSNRLGEDAADLEVFRVRPDGASAPEAVGLESPSAMMTRDGRWWIYRTSALEPGRFGDLMAMPVEGPSQPIALVATSAREAQPTLSRDGAWLAYSSDFAGTRQVYVRPFPAASERRRQVSTHGGRTPAFSPTSNELFIVEGGWMTALTYATEPTFTVTGRERLFDATPYDTEENSAASHPYDVTTDGARFVMTRRLEEPQSSLQQIVVSFSFLQELEGRASRD